MFSGPPPYAFQSRYPAAGRARPCSPRTNHGITNRAAAARISRAVLRIIPSVGRIRLKKMARPPRPVALAPKVIHRRINEPEEIGGINTEPYEQDTEHAQDYAARSGYV